MTAPRYTLAFVGVLVVLAGCTGTPAEPAGTGTPTDPASSDTPASTPDAGPAYESYVFDHAGAAGPAIEGGITYPEDGAGSAGYYVTVVDSASAADRFDHGVLDATASAFVRDTSFETHALVVIQTFPASSTPDYRVESVRRTVGGLAVSINDSSPGGTADVTVETVLLRVRGDPPSSVTVTTEEGRTFSTGGVVTVTPEPKPTPTPEPGVALPYASDRSTENVDEPRSLRVHNRGAETNGYRVRVVYHDRPDCLDATPACGQPTREVEVLDRRGKLRPGTDLTIPELALRKGEYTVSASAEVPAGNGSRTTVTDSMAWTLDEPSGEVDVRIADGDVSIGEVSE